VNATNSDTSPDMPSDTLSGEPRPVEPRTRPDKDARREAIIDVARDMFRAEGYAATSMSTIAATLGGSKGTLYNYFKSKEDLFEAYVKRQCSVYSAEMAGLLSDSGPVTSVLCNWGIRYLTKVTSDQKMREFRSIIAETDRWPEIGRIYYESGPHRGRQLLADYLTKVSERGELTIHDPLGAAHMFASLCSGRYYMARMAAFIPEPSSEEIETAVDRAIKIFCRTYDSANPIE
jgi:AcrR family transcriptional regulator